MTQLTSKLHARENASENSTARIHIPETSSTVQTDSENGVLLSHTLTMIRSKFNLLPVQCKGLNEKSELLQLREQLAQLESESLRKQHEFLLESFLLKHKLNVSEQNLKISQLQCKKLQKHRKSLLDSKNELQTRVASLENELKQCKSRYSSKNLELEKNFLKLEEESRSSKSKYEHESECSTQKILILETSINALENEVEQLQSRCRDYGEEVQVLTSTVASQQRTVDDLEMKQGQVPILELRSESLDASTKEMHRQQGYLQQLEIDLVKSKKMCEQLQVDRSQLTLLHEEKMSLKQKLQGMESLRQSLIAKESECETLREKWSLWDTAAGWTPQEAKKQIQGLESDLDLMRQNERLLSLRLESMHQQNTHAASEIRDMHNQQNEAEQKYWTLLTRVKTLEMILRNKEEEIRYLKEQVQLWTQFTESSTLSEAKHRESLVLESLQMEYRAEALNFKLLMELLFGVHFDQVTDGQVVIHSEYGNESETFVFLRTETGVHFQGFGEMATQAKYQSLFNLWRSRECVPGFLCALTLQNLKQRFPELEMASNHEESSKNLTVV